MQKNFCLGIESTAHTAGIGIVDKECKIFANERDSYKTIQGGLIPRELAEHHSKVFPIVLKKALLDSKISFEDISCIAYSKGPGIGPALEVGATTARFLSIVYNKPLVSVNHCVAHIEIAKKSCKAKDPLILYVSGGNTQIIGYNGFDKYLVYGETLDIGVGNLLDSFGREIGLGFPQGPKLDEMYFRKSKYVELPYTVKGMDLQFSGLLTAAKRKIGVEKKEDLVYSLMHTAFSMLTEVVERALAHTGKKELLVTGGVASSKSLAKVLSQMCKQRKVKLLVCPKELATDNGVMIAYAGLLKYLKGDIVKVEEANIDQDFRVDFERILYF
ncbi:MAG: KEOPS complex N(6)-L-threonylcarbamoyladenine synthase Kae1 [Candidatus Diapherotrites archaeon]